LVRIFDQMVQIGELGKGTTGLVKLVEDRVTKERIAVKVFSQPGASDPDFTRAFTNEVDMLITLRHPCILPIVGYSLPTRKTPAQLGTKYAVNGSLRAALHQVPRPAFLDETGTAIIICGLTHGLKFLHSKHVIHRDLKPENVLLDEHGWPMIGDFGCSRFFSLEVTQTIGVGTPLYMAPEMYDDTGYTTAVDVFSFALVLYEAVVGRPVFPPTLAPFALMKKVTMGERADLPQAMDATVKGIITQCWATDPDRTSVV
jgi:serine/threonine protein kinase